MEDSSLLKIIYQNKGKIIDVDHLTHKQLVRRLFYAFSLNHKNYYHLYYRDLDGDFITVQTQEDFQLFLNSPSRKKLCLDEVNDPKYHFLKRGRITQKTQTIDLQQVIRAKMAYFKQKVQSFKDEMSEKIENKVWLGLQQIFRNKQTHKDVFCAQCKEKRPIEGARYECIRCDFSLCEKCESKEEHIHPFIKIANESQAIAYKDNSLLYEDHDLKEILRQRRRVGSAGKEEYF